MADKKYDYSGKSDTALEKMIQKDSGASVEQATAAYRELSKRKGGMDFTVTMILGGRKLDKDMTMEAPPKKPKKKMYKGGMSSKKYNKGGYANCGASMPATQKSSRKN